jgi:ribosome-binding protein aMBF1 (putative translation factor)
VPVRFDNSRVPRKVTKPATKSVYLRKKTIIRKEYKIFLQLLIAERMGAGISQRLLAKRISVYQPYVARIERGERRIDLVEFLDFASAIGFDPQDFFAKFMRAIGQDGKKQKS